MNRPELAVLLAEQRDAFLGFLERRVGSRAIAEDLLQEAYSRGLERIDTLRKDESAVAWFYRVLRNAVVDHHRRNASATRALEALSAEPAPTELVGEGPAAVCQCVGRLAGALKPEYAEALRRVEVDGITVKSFADEAGITSNNAAVRVFRAREALRREVMTSCGSCAASGCFNCTCEPRREPS